ncbi:hypothetical protein AB2L57_00965 [Microbacterium sp. HA-8]|uniref:hypothetical protein n=1 Tax=Microbacterium sp. HA-8 TaxID=3234200 RepID=UPI0038F68167
MNVSALLLALTAVGILILLAVVFRVSARSAFIVWTLTLFFVPVWIGVNLGFFWAAVTGITLLAVVTGWRSVSLAPADALVAAFALLALILFGLRMVPLSSAVIAVLEWVLPYVWGRLVLARLPTAFVTRIIAAVATAAAVIAILEFASGTNVFLLLPAMGASFEEWGRLQPRGGFIRVEGAFGHSIALGAALAMSSAFVLATRWTLTAKLLSLAVISAATVVTFSRLGLLTLVLTVALSVVTLPGLTRRTRGAVIAVGAIAALVVVPFVGGVFLEAGDEASGSADYRSSLWMLLSQVQIIGSAGDWAGLTVGGTYLGQYADSIDNALLVIALRFGWIPVLLVIAVLVMVAVSVVRPGRANPASIAVTAQLPSLFAVALITQYGMYLWFLVGLAIAWPRRSPDGHAVEPVAVAQDVDGVRDDLEHHHARGIGQQRTVHPEHGHEHVRQGHGARGHEQRRGDLEPDAGPVHHEHPERVEHGLQGDHEPERQDDVRRDLELAVRDDAEQPRTDREDHGRGGDDHRPEQP